MTKKEIVKQISDKLKLPQIKVKEIVQLTFDTITDTLVRQGRIELRNFGVFEVKRRQPRKARNPRTGDPVQVEGKNVVTFQPGKVMEDAVLTAVLPTPMPANPSRRGANKALLAAATASVNGSAHTERDHHADPATAPLEATDELPLKPR